MLQLVELDYYIANAKPQHTFQIKVKMPKRIQPHLSTPVSLASLRALTLLQFLSHKLGVEVMSCRHHPNMKICKVCNVIDEKRIDFLSSMRRRLEDEYHVLLTCSLCKVIHMMTY